MSGEVAFSVILPIHNEKKHLALSLPSIFKLKPDEIIFLFDHCTDGSKKLAGRIIHKFNFWDKCTLIIPPDSPDWKNRIAFLRRYGTNKAQNDLVLFTAADMILDPQIKKYFELLGKHNIQLLSFMHIDYPVNWRNLIKRVMITSRLAVYPTQRWLAGVMYYSRQVAEELEDMESIKNCVSGEDTHLHHAIQTKYRSCCLNTKNLHLRPRGTSQDYMCGGLYWSVTRRSLFVTLCSTLFFLRLNLWRGYVHERFGRGNNESQ